MWRAEILFDEHHPNGGCEGGHDQAERKQKFVELLAKVQGV